MVHSINEAEQVYRQHTPSIDKVSKRRRNNRQSKSIAKRALPNNDKALWQCVNSFAPRMVCGERNFESRKEIEQTTMIKRRKLKVEELNRIDVQEFKKAKKIGLTVVLDNIRSLNNIGSVFRTSDAFRVEKILLCGITATPPHIDIHKTALGAEDSIAWQHYDETIDAVNKLKAEGYTVFAIEQA